MKVIAKKNRELALINAQNTQNENRAETITLVVPEEYEDYNKKIVFVTDDGIVWDIVQDNTYKLTKAITKYKQVDFYIWLTKEVDGESIDFRTKTKTLNFYHNVDASDEITDEEIHGVNTVVNLLEEEIEKVENLNIEATKIGHTTTVTITKKDGTTESVEINDGQDGQDGYTPQKGIDYFTEQDIEEIEGDILDEVYTKAQTDTLLEGKADIEDIPDVSNFITKDVNNLTNYTLKTNTGSLIDLEINDTTYVVTLKLKNQDGTVISTDTIDLPLESVVVSGRYDNTTKKVILTLENGSEVDFSVADLVAGLQTEITSQNKLASDLVDDTNSGNKFVTTTEKQTWNNKLDESDLADYVKNTDYANGSKGGTIKVASSVALAVDTGGILYGQTKQYNEYSTGANSMVVSKGTLENVITGKQLINQTQLEESQESQDEQIEALQTENARLKATIPTTTGEGENVTLDKTAEFEFVKPPLPRGNTKQETTTGKNLLPPLDSGFLNGLTFTTNSNGITTISGTTTSVTTYFKNVNKILPAGTYTLSINLSYTPPANSSQLILQDINNVRLATINLWKITSKTFTLSSDTEIKNYYLFSNNGIQHNGTISIQLEKGSTATSYEPYTNGASPNPDYPQEITNVTGDVEVVVENKNLIDYKTVENTSNTTVQLIDNGFKVTGKYAGKIVIENLKPNTNYYLQYIRQNIIGSTVSVVVFGGTTTSNIIKTLTSSDVFNSGNNTTINIWFYASMGGADGEANFTNIQLEESTIATDYVEHREQTFTFPLGNEKLMLGDYLADDGIHHVMGETILGDVTYLTTGTVFGTQAQYATFGLPPDSKNVGRSYDFLCDRISHANEVFGQYKGYRNQKSLFVLTTFDDTLENFNNKISGSILQYELEEEVIVPYTSAQQEVYNQIKQALSYEEQTNIRGSSNGSNPLFSVEAYQSTKLILQNIDSRLTLVEG